jgi:hypothetical protein
VRLLFVSAFLTLGVLVLGSSACVRVGYDSHPKPTADGGKVNKPAKDASALPDAGAKHDAAAVTDASEETDATTAAPDASTKTDAAVATPDASPETDASTGTPDASTQLDAATPPGPGPCMPVPMRDYCMRLPALLKPPVLDGSLDCGPPLIPMPAMGWNSSGTMPSDNKARYAAAWRPDGLYIYVEVDDMLVLPALASDVDPWCGDGIELYADSDGNYVSAPDYDYPGGMQLLATAPAPDASTSLAVDALYHTRSQVRVGNWSATRHVKVLRNNGYALEAFIAAADLELNSWTLAAGSKVGFDIAINLSVADGDSDFGCGRSLGQYYLRLSRSPCTDDSCRPFSNAAAFCTAMLE